MPRKDLLRDLAICQQTRIPHVADVRQGSESDIVAFTFFSDSLPDGYVNIQVLIPEAFDYPNSHHYILFVENQENVPPRLTGLLEEIQEKLGGKSLLSMINEVSDRVASCLSQGSRSNPVYLSDAEEEDGQIPGARSGDGESSDEFEVFEPDDHDLDDDEIFFPRANLPPASSVNTTRCRTIAFSEADISKIKSDLRITKQAGFKIGLLGDLRSGSILCVSIRVAKLGISEEGMQAWGLQRPHYLVLMIKFEGGYRTLQQVSEMSSLTEQADVRVVLCKHYKPDSTQAFRAFASARKDDRDNETSLAPVPHDQISELLKLDAIEPVFISGPLNSLFRERFPIIVRYRLACGVPWLGAEACYNDNQGISYHSEIMENKYYADEPLSRALKPIVTADAIADGHPNPPLPLVSMQFLLRHLVRCTEFCLVCHCKVDNTFEALKPYVCSKPLCLYQYINLGFGPSIEWEILTQPYVVDLLVSFCYTSCRNGKLKDFPIGLGLTVPNLPGTPSAPLGLSALASDDSARLVATYGSNKQELLFSRSKYPVCPIRTGTYLVFSEKNSDTWTHARVDETRFYPSVKLGVQSLVRKRQQDTYPHPALYSVPSPAPSSTSSVADPESFRAGSEVKVFLYDHVFDTLPDHDKRQSINLVLDTLPSVTELQSYLLAGDQGSHPTLQGRLLDPALTLLRWIVASNRSCILQVHPTMKNHLGQGANPKSSLTATADDRVGGMAGWVQFRFAQGAPDKEQRFVNAVSENCSGHKHPTLFAWHGSPIYNWHAIVREGLHFKIHAHGRAYGDGVYMSPHAATSLGYCNSYGLAKGDNPTVWPNSVLKISQALSLQEVVNKPEKFLSKSPHYVVQEIEWIQTRYLFVKGQGTSEITASCDSTRPECVYDQDPSAPVHDQDNTKLLIPITAISKSRRPTLSAGVNKQAGGKKSKSLALTNEQAAEEREDDANSVVSDVADRAFLEEDYEVFDPMDYTPHSPQGANRALKRPLNDKNLSLDTALTDFVPGRLDTSGLKMLDEPQDASVFTTKALMKMLRETLKVQDTTPLHELGWYIDRHLVTNMYQWVVELHSFESSLPLAQDMKAANITSVVLELRFTNSFPFSPPFVRVVRPRFLPFNSGGGGHVTAGGAICMELLTNSGWLVTNTIESVLLQIRIAISSLDPRPARLESIGRPSRSKAMNGCYGVGEAIEAYKRACAVHGWQVPPDFKTLQTQ